MTKPNGEHCAQCPMQSTGNGFVPDLVRPSELIEIRGERPWKSELALGQPFAGRAGFVLKAWGIDTVPALKVAWDRSQVSLTNTLRCLPPNLERDSYPRKKVEREEAEKCCAQYRSSVALNVVLAGEHAQRAEFGVELDREDALDRAAGRELKGVMGRIGRTYERNGRRYVFAPHPSAVLRQPTLVEHLQAALKIAGQAPTWQTIRDAQDDENAVDWLACNYVETVGSDFEWQNGVISVIGTAWDYGRIADAVPRATLEPKNYAHFLSRYKEIVGHNWHAADLRQLAKEGVDVTSLEPKVFDTLLALHATHAHLAGTGSYDIRSAVLLLGEQAGVRFPLDWKDYEGDIYKTCREDAAASLWISAPLKRLIAQYNLHRTVAISHAVAPIFARMHERGVRLDRAVLERIHNERQTRTLDIIARYGLSETRGVKKKREVPIWRSNRVLDIFEHAFGFRPPNRTRSTWEGLAANPHLTGAAREFASAVADLSKGANDAHWLGKAEESDYGVAFEKVDSAGYIHPQYAIHGSPDRPIAKSPNIQNFPRVSDDPRPTPLRASVVPFNDDELLLACDYSGVETWTTAIEADDWPMVASIQRGERSHERMAHECSKIAGWTLTRQQGKAVNHAFDKGESPANLAKRLYGASSVTNKQKRGAHAMYAALLARYPVTAQFRLNLWDRAQSNPLVVHNKFGRRLQCFARSRYGEDRDWAARHDPKLAYWCPCKQCAPRRERWKYALAFLGRSSAVDVLLRVMDVVWRERRLDNFSLPVLEAHDELAWSVPRSTSEKYSKIVLDTFESPVLELNDTALPAEAHIGRNWSECK